MEGVKSKYIENTIQDIKIQKQLIRVKRNYFEALTAQQYMHNKYNKPKYLKEYLIMLKALNSTEFISLHKAMIGIFKDWISETIEQDISQLEDLNKQIKNF